MVLTVEREWSREPGWFSTLPVEQQAVLLGEFRARFPKNTREVTLKDWLKTNRSAPKGG